MFVNIVTEIWLNKFGNLPFETVIFKNKKMRTLILIFISFCGFCQVPEIPKFNPVVITDFNGAPARNNPIITSNIKYWISPNAEIIAIDYEIDSKFIKVVHQKDTVFVYYDNFTKNLVVQEQLNKIFNAEKGRKKYYENIIELEKRYKDSLNLVKEEKIKAIEKKDLDDVKNNLKKLLIKYQSLGSPFIFLDAIVSHNSIGIPEANLTAHNISGKDIDAYEVSILCYDNYNRPVNHYLYKTNVFEGLSQQLVEPSNETSSLWTLYGYENTTKITIILKSVHYKGKNAWYPKNKIFIKSE